MIKTPAGNFHSFNCATSFARMKRNKEIKKKDKERIKTRSEWLREAQTEFNKWIRERDRDEPCISCQRHHDGQYHAGHYKTTAAHPELRFHPFNVNKQCSPCNNHLSGNLVEYRKNLIIKIGLPNLEWLEEYQPPMRLDIEDLKELKLYFRALANQARKEF